MHSISPYLIKTYDKSLAGVREEKYCVLDKIRGNNLIDLVEEFTKKYTTSFTEVEQGENKSFKFSNINRIGNEISGYMEFGIYGNASEIHDIEKGTKVHDKKPNESDINKFFFYFKIFKERKVGFFLSQNIHGNGIKSEFSRKFNDFYRIKTNGLSLQFNPFSSKEILREWYECANVKELKIVDFTVGRPKDIADQLHESFAEITFKPTKRNAFFGKLSEIKNKTDIIAILSEYGRKVTAIAELNGKKRTFSLSSDGEPISAIEIDDVVDMNEGNPILSSILNESQKITNEFKDEIEK
jgi:hypothetical protein